MKREDLKVFYSNSVSDDNILLRAYDMLEKYEDALLYVESKRGKLLVEIMEKKLGESSVPCTMEMLRSMVKDIGFPFVYHSSVKDEDDQETLWMWFVPVNPLEKILFKKIPLKKSISDISRSLQHLSHIKVIPRAPSLEKISEDKRLLKKVKEEAKELRKTFKSVSLIWDFGKKKETRSTKNPEKRSFRSCQKKEVTCPLDVFRKPEDELEEESYYSNSSSSSEGAEEEDSSEEANQEEKEIEEIYKILQELYNYLLKPFEDRLPNKFAVVSPYRIPWNFLISNNCLPQRFLVQDHIVLSNPSVRATFLLQKKSKQPHQSQATRPLIVVNPTMSVDLIPLPGSESEGLFLTQYFGDQNCVYLYGDKATKDEVMKHFSTAMWIHLATHCFSNYHQHSFSFLESALAISRNDKPDLSWIKAKEIIFELPHMHAKCVIFSACNSGDGVVTEEGLLDFSWACLAQGVPNVIVALYKVPDNSTTLLMENFYAFYDQSKDVSRALQQAICKRLNKSVQDGIPVNILCGGFVSVGL